MANVTTIKPIQYYGTPVAVPVPVNAAATYYEGQLVFSDVASTESGYAVQTPASTDTFIGICSETKTVTAQGDLIPIYTSGIFGFKISGTTVADIGDYACIDASAITNNPDDVVAHTDITEGANDQMIGEIITVIGSYAYVDLGKCKPAYNTQTVGTDGGSVYYFAPIAK